MAKLSMHENLPFDEATAPPRVSTGDLPMHAEIEKLVTEAHELYRGEDSGSVADYIPVLAEASPDLFGIAVVGPWGRSFEIGDVTTRFSIQSVSKPFVFALVVDTLGYEAARMRLGVNSTGFPFNSLMVVELNDDRTMNPLVNAGAIATTSLVPGDTAEQKFARIRDGLRARLNGHEGRPVALLVFDVLHLDGVWLLRTPLEKRRAALRRILRPGDEVVVVPAIAGEGRALHDAVSAQGIAGVLARRRTSPYLPGVRSRLWRSIAATPPGTPVQVEEAPTNGADEIDGGRSSGTGPVLALFRRLPFDDEPESP